MSNDYSSFNKDKKIFDGWRQFLNESSVPGLAVLDEVQSDEELAKARQNIEKNVRDALANTPAGSGDGSGQDRAPKVPPLVQHPGDVSGGAKVDAISGGEYTSPEPGQTLEKPSAKRDELEEQETVPNPEYTGKPRPEFEDTVGSPVVRADNTPSEKPGPAGIEIDPVAKAAMDQRPEFGDLGVAGDTYFTADMEQLKLGSDYDFLKNATPLPSLMTAYSQGLIDPKTDRLTDRGRATVRGWQAKQANQKQAMRENFDHIVQEVYKRLTTKPKGK